MTLKYKTLDEQAQEAALRVELNRLETEHLRLVIQDPDPQKDSASEQQQQELEDRIKKMQVALTSLEEGEPVAKKAAARKQVKSTDNE